MHLKGCLQVSALYFENDIEVLEHGRRRETKLRRDIEEKYFDGCMWNDIV